MNVYETISISPPIIFYLFDNRSNSKQDPIQGNGASNAGYRDVTVTRYITNVDESKSRFRQEAIRSMAFSSGNQSLGKLEMFKLFWDNNICFGRHNEWE